MGSRYPEHGSNALLKLTHEPAKLGPLVFLPLVSLRVSAAALHRFAHEQRFIAPTRSLQSLQVLTPPPRPIPMSALGSSKTLA